MRQLLGLFTIAAIALLVAAPAAQGGDIDDLKAAHEQLNKTVGALDTDGLPALLHEQMAGYLRNNPFPVRRPTPELLKEVWAEVERNTSTMINPQYAVVGSTGIVWGHASGVSKMKGGPEETFYSRVTYTYIKQGGKWLLLSFHVSAIPSD